MSDTEKWALGWSEEAAIEVPKLSALKAALLAVCREYGVGFELTGGYGEDDRGDIVIVPFSEEAIDLLFKNLADYDGGISWLDEAKAVYEAKRDELYKQREEAARAAKLARERAEIDAILREGVMIGGKPYRVVPKE